MARGITQFPSSDFQIVLISLRNYSPTTSGEKKLYKKTIEAILRKYSEQRPPTHISDKAKAAAASLGIALNINQNIRCHADLHKLCKLGLDVTLDHCNPIDELIGKVTNTTIQVNNILNDNITALITTSENKKLQKDYKKNRPNGYRDCYEKVGIVI